MGTKFLYRVMKMVWNWILVMIAQDFEYTKNTELYTLKWLK